MKITVIMVAGLLLSATHGYTQDIELEVDPFPYLLQGFSAHVGMPLSGTVTRAQIGVFGAQVPESIHGEDDFDLRIRAATLKLDHFFGGNNRGWFAGADMSYARLRYTWEPTGEEQSRNQLWLGPRIGYRWEINDRLYLVPWLSVLYRTNSGTLAVGDGSFDDERYAVLPTAHLGWQF